MREHGAQVRSDKRWGDEPSRPAIGVVSEAALSGEKAAEAVAEEAPEKEADDAGACVIVGVPADKVMLLWDRIEHHFTVFARLTRGEETAREILASVLERKRQIWLAVFDRSVIACVITCIRPATPNCRVIIEFCSGERRELWMDAMLDEVERWARQTMNAGEAVILGRSGWTKELRLLGYKDTERLFRKGL